MSRSRAPRGSMKRSVRRAGGPERRTLRCSCVCPLRVDLGGLSTVRLCSPSRGRGARRKRVSGVARARGPAYPQRPSASRRRPATMTSAVRYGMSGSRRKAPAASMMRSALPIVAPHTAGGSREGCRMHVIAGRGFERRDDLDGRPARFRSAASTKLAAMPSKLSGDSGGDHNSREPPRTQRIRSCVKTAIDLAEDFRPAPPRLEAPLSCPRRGLCLRRDDSTHVEHDPPRPRARPPLLHPASMPVRSATIAYLVFRHCFTFRSGAPEAPLRHFFSSFLTTIPISVRPRISPLLRGHRVLVVVHVHVLDMLRAITPSRRSL